MNSQDLSGDGVDVEQIFELNLIICMESGFHLC